MRGHINPWRAVWAYALFSGAINYPDIALVNTSTGPHMLDVRAIFSDANQNGAAQYWKIVPNFAGTKAADGIPVVGGEGVPPGAIYTLDDPIAFSSNEFYFFGAQSVMQNPLAHAPLALLRPGWALVGQCSSAGVNIGITFYYQWLSIDELVPGFDEND